MEEAFPFPVPGKKGKGHRQGCGAAAKEEQTQHLMVMGSVAWKTEASFNSRGKWLCWKRQLIVYNKKQNERDV